MSKYVNSWIKANCKTVTLRFNVKKQADVELYDHLQKQPNKTDYLKSLVMRDIIVEKIGEKRAADIMNNFKHEIIVPRNVTNEEVLEILGVKRNAEIEKEEE